MMYRLVTVNIQLLNYIDSDVNMHMQSSRYYELETKLWNAKKILLLKKKKNLVQNF